MGKPSAVKKLVRSALFRMRVVKARKGKGSYTRERLDGDALDKIREAGGL